MDVGTFKQRFMMSKVTFYERGLYPLVRLKFENDGEEKEKNTTIHSRMTEIEIS